jgi:hypothetical protein
MSLSNDSVSPQEHSASSARRSGRFSKGTSGNPAGRPRGSRNRSTVLVEALLQEEAEPLTRKLIEMAKEGDPIAMRLCMDRLSPARKDRTIDLPRGPVETLPQIRSGMSTVVQAIGDGSITPAEGETVANVLTLQSNVVTNTEIVPRLEQLEEQVATLQKQNTAPAAPDIDRELRDHANFEEGEYVPA